jgi:predicted amidohydrolase YtcJ
LLIRDTEVEGRRLDVRVAGGVITEVAPGLSRAPGEEAIEAGGGALLPGLHDHHLHLLAMAAAEHSIQLGPPKVTTPQAFSAALTAALTAALGAAAPGRWIRGVGYHDSVTGPLDRDGLDRLVPDRPVRIQHRSGALWVLNSAALAAADLEQETDPDVERDASGRLTGRLFRWDTRLGERLRADAPAPDLRDIGFRLARFGITGVTDATPDLDDGALGLLEAAAATGALPQNVMLLGAPNDRPLAANFTRGPHKILLRDHDLPGTDELTRRIAAAHAARRGVAVHCVTRESLLLTLAALATAGVMVGDRLEHAAVVPPELCADLAREGLSVVTQPAFIAERGDAYLAEVDPADHACLYPYASLLAAGIPVAPSSDAPFGEADPWKIIAAASSRRSAGGQLVAPQERVDPATALAGYLSPAEHPGGPVRRVRPGAPADLCLLKLPLAAVLRTPTSENVAITLCRGSHAQNA